ncbi:CTP synthase C-terminal region-related (seleno)protein [Nocardiopsis suaedae]|uniref:CTP synthase (glutamine hydrolyzing) n=1 Tax=Nocardiopsis suaedae TaxID=3018444 RepID=A0ABT4TNH4_9ACTN|nr:hypothetical protein [Nocardiopsis suaedae]MDA2806253.1 hypothetical protein [Nocardiopsis suaedae]
MQHTTEPRAALPAARLALVADRSPHVRAHARVPGLLEGVRRHEDLLADAYWVPTEEAAAPGRLDGFDGVWLMPGSPYRSEAGALAAVRTARTRGVPFLGTCGGFQHALLEFARGVCGLSEARHGESDPDAEEPLIAPLACSLVGHEGEIRCTPGSLAARVLGTERRIERYHCSYGPAPEAAGLLEGRGLRFTGHDEQGRVRVAELEGHPFFLATLFQPELADGPRPHPVVRAFTGAAADRAAGRTAAAPEPVR